MAKGTTILLQSLAMCFCNSTHGFLVRRQKFTGMHYCHLNNNIFLPQVLDKTFLSSSILHNGKLSEYIVFFSTSNYWAESRRHTRRISLGDYTVYFNNNSCQFFSLWFRKQKMTFFFSYFQVDQSENMWGQVFLAEGINFLQKASVFYAAI